MSTLREQFERWVRQRYGFDPHRHGDGYSDGAMNDEWQAWRESARLALEEAARECEGVTCGSGYPLHLEGRLSGVAKCAAAIRNLAKGMG